MPSRRMRDRSGWKPAIELVRNCRPWTLTQLYSRQHKGKIVKCKECGRMTYAPCLACEADSRKAADRFLKAIGVKLPRE